MRNRRKNSPFSPKAADLKDLATSFSFEVGVLVSQGRLYLDEGKSLAEDKERLYPAADALLDAILVRLRSFDSFLRNIASHGTEAVARHVVPQWQARKTLTRDQRTMINVRVAHLTYERPGVHEWPIGKMIRLTLEVIRDFIAAAGSPPEWASRQGEVNDWLDNWGDRDRIWTENDNHAHTR
jgi:hypothetical protein